MARMVPLIPYTSDELMELPEDDLKMVRADFFNRLSFEDRSDDADDAILDLMQLFSMVQDLCAWRRHAEPGMAAKIMSLGPEWEEEIERAREMDQRSIGMHTEIAARFERAGGRDALAAALRKINSFANP